MSGTCGSVGQFGMFKGLVIFKTGYLVGVLLRGLKYLKENLRGVKILGKFLMGYEIS